MNDRHTVDSITSDALDALYASLEAAHDTELYRQLRTADAAFASASVRAARAEAALARVQALAEEHPAGIDTALIHEALAEQPTRTTPNNPPTSTDTHNLTVQQADALWDAVAIPGPDAPTFVTQHERVCRSVATLLAEQPYQQVQGRCPACGWTSLFLGDGGHPTCSRLECPNPSAADQLLHHTDATECGHEAALGQAQAELTRLCAGEEDGYAPHAVPTPGQWLWRFNRAPAEERLDVLKRLLGLADRGGQCFEMAHEKRLDDEQKAWVKVARVRDVIADMERITGARHWARILRTAVDGEQPPPVPAATEPQADSVTPKRQSRPTP